MSHPPVVVVESGGVPRTQVADGVSAPAFTVAVSGARAITLADNAPPIALLNANGTRFEPYDEAAVDLFARFTSTPTTVRKGQINNLIVALKAAGVWDKLDALYVIAAADTQAAGLNWIADQYNATAVSDPVFAADRGYTTDGLASYIESNFNLATAVSPKFATASGSLGFWSRTTAQAAIVDMGNSTALVTARNSSDIAAHRINWSMTGNVASTDGSGDFVSSRTGTLNTDNKLYRNGAEILADVPAGSATTDVTNSIQIGKRGGAATYSARQFAIAHIGGGLTAGEIDAFYDAKLAYLTAVGAA